MLVTKDMNSMTPEEAIQDLRRLYNQLLASCKEEAALVIEFSTEAARVFKDMEGRLQKIEAKLKE